MNTRPLFDAGSNLSRSVTRRIVSSTPVVLFLDYDGTLVPIRTTPAAATLSPRTRRLLVRLASHPEIVVSIVTGRSVSDIKSLVHVPRLRTITNHGFEISWGRLRWTHPEARRARPALSRAARGIRASLQDVQGLLIEQKGLTVSVHYRNVRERDIECVKSAVEFHVRRSDVALTTTSGKRVVEIRPRVSWGKGRAIVRVLRTIRPPVSSLIVSVGDDITDEDAFRLLPAGGISIAVGPQQTAASYRVDNPGSVRRFLEKVLSLKS
jgi:trehalose 6-phosphate phosphatase